MDTFSVTANSHQKTKAFLSQQIYCVLTLDNAMLQALGTQQLAKQENFCSDILHYRRGRQNKLIIHYSVSQVVLNVFEIYRAGTG